VTRAGIRAALLAIPLVVAIPALAQEQPVPRTDIEQLRKEARVERSIRAAVAAADRSLNERLRDETRDIEIILKASKAKPGDRVLDVASGGGYLAVVFSHLVGEKGHVDLHNTPGWIAQFPTMEPETQKKFLRQKNLSWVTVQWNDLTAPDDTYDVIVLGRVYHDVVYEGGDFLGMTKRFFKMLKPGGYVLVEDHDADERMHVLEQATLHRISHGDTIAHFTRAGFRTTDLILFDSKYDDRRWNVFRPGVKGRTDHYIAVFEKPKG